MTRVIDDEGIDMSDIAHKVDELCRNEPVKEDEIIFAMPHWMTVSDIELSDIFYQF